MEFKDYYKIMGVSRDASAEEIKRAYRKLARKYHPDVSKEPDAEARFKEINEACEVLKDPEKRAAYDQLGTRWKAGEDFRPPPDWNVGGFDFGGFEGGPTHFSDFFEALFGGASPFGTRRSPRQGFRMRGENEYARLQISLEEAYRGATRTITLQIPEPDAQGRLVTRTRTLQVRIPAGVTQGQQIRLAGQGAPGIGGGPAGDLFLEIELLAHPLFRLEGRDVYLDLPVTPWEAALGATVSVPTLGGTVDMKIPAGSQSGQKLRLRGRGLPGRSPGDQYVVLQIMTPPAHNEAAKDLYRRMAREMPFNPRSKLGV